jgi:hypothetical protein
MVVGGVSDLLSQPAASKEKDKKIRGLYFIMTPLTLIININIFQS